MSTDQACGCSTHDSIKLVVKDDVVVMTGV
jgi:hypothetical protein